MKQEFKQELLSGKAKENLQRNEMIRREDSPFLQIVPNEEMSLRFDPELIEVKEINFDGFKKRKIRYTVVDVTGDRTKFWTVSQKTSAEIDSYLKNGKRVLKVKRIGSGLETKYTFSPL